MKLRGIIVSMLLLVLVSTLIVRTHAEIEIQIDNDETAFTPIVFGNVSGPFQQQAPNDMCASSDGRMFVVSFVPDWQSIRGPTPASIVAWENDGRVLWSQTATSWDRVLYQIATDNQRVFAIGEKDGNLFLAEYDVSGHSLLNTSLDLGGTEYGTKIALLEDGTVVVGGHSVNSSGYTTEYFLAAFDQDGQIRWYDTYSESPYFSCYSNSIYTCVNSTLQKRASSGVIEWSMQCNVGFPVCINNQLFYILNFPENTSRSCFNVTKWSINTQERIWSFNYSVFDEEKTVHNISILDHSVTPNGSLMILSFVYDLAKFYLFTINQEGLVTSHINVYDGIFLPTCFEVTQDDKVHVAGTSNEFGMFVAVYDLDRSLHPNNGLNLSDFETIAVVAAAVILFDASFIIYLRKRYGK